MEKKKIENILDNFSNLEKKPLLIPSDYTGRMAIKT